MRYLSLVAMRGQQLLEEIRLAFPVSQRHVLDGLRAAVQHSSLRIALVGGLPREILRCSASQRERENLYDELRDIDIVVEGDAIDFARELYRRLPGELVVNDDFRTATLTVDGLEIDLSSSRRESYSAPGQLPDVDTGGIRLEEDLSRRDFTINAIAIELNPDYGNLLDPLGGEADLRARVLRILHSASFHDEPDAVANHARQPGTRAVDVDARGHATLRKEAPAERSELVQAEIPLPTPALQRTQAPALTQTNQNNTPRRQSPTSNCSRPL